MQHASGMENAIEGDHYDDDDDVLCNVLWL